MAVFILTKSTNDKLFFFLPLSHFTRKDRDPMLVQFAVLYQEAIASITYSYAAKRKAVDLPGLSRNAWTVPSSP